ncbi:MAG: beta-aspartyl-peptidase [Acidobacteria bacterium]|nr:beta-aspartyl-peptidase [Acidobacteriota bacterium]
MLLLKNGEVYDPESLGRRDILVAGGKIVALEKKIPPPAGIPLDIIEAEGMITMPGLIDGHVHIAGAGGEGGPATRTPEMQLGQMLEAGCTTVIGCLGTDGLTRSVESVLMKAKALRAEGASCWIFTGSYQVPPPTILGDVGKDIALIDEIIGVGEIAIADHRSSFPTVEELIRLAEHARVGGMLGGKAGIVNLHMGDADHPFAILYEAVARSELRLTQFLPTHCNRNATIFEESIEYGKHGYVDLTTSSYPYFSEVEIKPSAALVRLLAAGVPGTHITFSSDACGSLPQFDGDGRLVKLETGRPRANLAELIDAVRREGIPWEQALPVVTSNAADILKLSGKGRIRIGHDADLVVLDSEDKIRHLVMNGVLAVRDGRRLVKGTFEN